MENRLQMEANDLFKILDSIYDAIYIADKNGVTLWINKASEMLLGKSREEVIGRTISELEQEGMYSPSAMRIAQEGRQQTVTTVQILANGQKLLVTAQSILDQENELKYMVSHGRNITTAMENVSFGELGEVESLFQRYLIEIRKTLIHVPHLNENELFFVGRSKAFAILLEWINKVAEVDSTVLITGETGVGKNLVAGQIHKASARYDKPFIHVNCAAIPEALLESELFGYQKGAFTGASANGKAGLVKLAEQGTLFLDEINEIPLHLQSKLLQLLQNKTYMPIGASQTLAANVRIIAATNGDLEESVKKGTFRADLFYRLHVLPIHIPPLRERREDIFHLLEFYLKKFTVAFKKKREFSPKTVELLQHYHWPGNIRELGNLVEQLVILAPRDKIDPSDLPRHITTKGHTAPESREEATGGSLTSMVEELEKRMIEQAYDRYQSTRRAAEALGITHSLLMRRIAKYQIKTKRKKPS